MSETKHNCVNVTITPDTEKSEVEIKAEIPLEKVREYRVRALAKLKETANMAGFRKGHVPEDVLIKQIGEGALMQKVADTAITEELPLLLATENILAISAPSVTITKLASENPIGFTAKIAVMPQVELSDYKKISKKHNAKKVTTTTSDEEVEETLTHLRRERAKIEKIEAGAEPAAAHEESQKMDTLSLPGIDDVFVQTLGYKDAEDFKVKLKENIKKEKQAREDEKHRISLIEAIIADSKVPVPDVLVDHELQKMESQMAADLEQAGTTFDAYLKQVGKTREDLHKDWREAAQKRARMQLVLAQISQKEDLKADSEELEKHVKHVLEHHKDIDEMNVRGYYEQVLRNDATLKWLESQK